MKGIGIVVLTLLVASIDAPSSAGVRVEFSTQGNVATSLSGEESVVDGFSLRAAADRDTDGPVHIGPALTWWYQRHGDNSWGSFEPRAPNPCGRKWDGAPDSEESNFLDVSVIARTLAGTPGLGAFSEFEAGVAFNDMGGQARMPCFPSWPGLGGSSGGRTL